ncbi:hypothetical protein NMY22_g3140 [Coprinellus aureogranulatus]|nr:hypothetical protein NMY22_g3140 [Coprinellus aureogranulatus]
MPRRSRSAGPSGSEAPPSQSDSSSTDNSASESDSDSNIPAYERKNRKMRRQRAKDGLESEDENDGYGQSAYNDNMGIKAIVTLVLFLDPKKRTRANQKLPTESCMVYFHEDYPLRDFLVKIVKELKREDLLEHSAIYNGQQDSDANSISLTYTVPWKVKNPLRILTDLDFANMVKEAASTAHRQNGATVHITITELKPRTDTNSSETTPNSRRSKNGNRNSGNDSSSDDEQAKKPSKKKSRKKTLNLSPQEQEEVELIQDLSDRHKCNDKDCQNQMCILIGPDAEHLGLTFNHIRTWVAALQAKLPGVTKDDPPDNKMFKLAVNRDAKDTMDIALLAKRRLAQVAAAQTQPAPQPDILQPAMQMAQAFMTPVLEMCRTAFMPAQVPAHTLPAPNPLAMAGSTSTPDTSLLEPMELDDFAMLFGLSENITFKLAAADIPGPHVLRLVSDKDLREDGKLSIGELATVRDAEQRWKIRQASLS